MDDTMVGREVWTWATERVDALPVRPRLMRYERDGGEQGGWLNLRAVSNPADCIPAVDSRPNLRVYDSERDALLDWIAVVEERIQKEPAAVRKRLLDELHPTGRCTCAGEGACVWCQMAALRERAEDAEAERDALRARVADLEAAQLWATHRWIPVDEQLPEVGEAVYITGPAIGQAVAVYYGGDDPWRLDAFRSQALRGEHVSHWRRLLLGPTKTKKEVG